MIALSSKSIHLEIFFKQLLKILFTIYDVYMALNVGRVAKLV